MKLFLDFDDVLFDTRNLNRDLMDAFALVGISAKEFRESYELVKRQSRNGYAYDIEDHLKLLEQRTKFNRTLLEEEIQKILCRGEVLVFPDVKPFFHWAQTAGFQTAIVSFGSPTFQQRKIEYCGVREFVQAVHVGATDKGTVVKDILLDYDLSTIFFIDDRSSFLEEVKRANPPVVTILMRRPEGRYRDEPNEWCDAMVTNLDEAREYISQMIEIK